MTTPAEAPPISTLSSHDLQRLAELAHLVGAAQDAMSDDVVTRLASTMSESIALIDRLTRNEGLMRLLQILDKPEMQHLLKGFGDALAAISREVSGNAPAKGGLVGMLGTATEPGTQEALRVMSIFGQHLSESLRELHHKGG